MSRAAAHRSTGGLGALLLALALPLTVLGVAPASSVTTDRAGASSDADRRSTRGAADRQADPPFVVVAVGDIACPPDREPTETLCRQGDTAALAQQLEPNRVLALGDLQYESGELANFRTAYESSWGPLRPITLPIPGNHEYRTPDATGYYTYFADRQPGAPGYYSRRLGAWTVYALNSMCNEIDCGRQLTWLRRQLRDDTACSLAIWHHPRFASHDGEPGVRRVKPFFDLLYERGVEMVISGHHHNYERFRPMNGEGASRLAKGVVQFVSGGGGKNVDTPTVIATGSESVIGEFGVLRLGLRTRSYRSSFRGIDGSVQDRTSGTCHAPPP